MAAAVYHSSYLLDIYPNHEVLNSPLFQTQHLLETLRPLLGNIHGDTLVRAGVSEHFAVVAR